MHGKALWLALLGCLLVLVWPSSGQITGPQVLAAVKAGSASMPTLQQLAAANRMSIGSIARLLKSPETRLGPMNHIFWDCSMGHHHSKPATSTDISAADGSQSSSNAGTQVQPAAVVAAPIGAATVRRSSLPTARITSAGIQAAAAAVSLNSEPLTSEAFNLHSRPGARIKVLLEFRAGTVTGTSWNSAWGLPTITVPAYDMDGNPSSFSTAERQMIISVWRMVAEAYVPWDVDITTDVSVQNTPGWLERWDDTSDTFGGIVRITTTTASALSNGKLQGVGTAFTGSLGYAELQPSWVIVSWENWSSAEIAQCAAHEIGHQLGLVHDGIKRSIGGGTGNDEYFFGDANWGPIMGGNLRDYSADMRRVVQWSDGDYSGATNPQNDIAVISRVLPRLPDDFPNTQAAIVADVCGTVAGACSNRQVTANGMIHDRSDVDYLRLPPSVAGTLQVTVRTLSRQWDTFARPGYSTIPLETRHKLAISLQLLDAGGNIVAQGSSATSGTSVMAALAVNVPAGNYTVRIAPAATSNTMSYRWFMSPNSGMTGAVTYSTAPGTIGSWRLEAVIPTPPPPPPPPPPPSPPPPSPPPPPPPSPPPPPPSPPPPPPSPPPPSPPPPRPPPSPPPRPPPPSPKPPPRSPPPRPPPRSPPPPRRRPPPPPPRRRVGG